MSAPLRNLKLIIEYEGTRYAGWALQDNAPSIAGCLIEAIAGMTGVRSLLSVAGRTDAGVHALAQVVSFTTASHIEARRFAPGLNSYLPDDISIHTAREVSLTFDARRDSLSKRYRYRVYRGPQPAALERHRAWYLHQELDLEAMRMAAAALVGEHDFEAFRSTQCDAPHARRTMHAVDLARTPRPPVGEHIDITLHANAYCRHMCRILAGTLIEVGLGKRSAGGVAEILAARDRKRAG
ncbi:MAG: tRNA pseudouridine(38-40) synthase TruA, partial [Deltaproteobacteria bacterium]|nr:tRNA pseudouridine(38-40) synthase TruA [Deltaproteobacteria bacterium]